MPKPRKVPGVRPSAIPANVRQDAVNRVAAGESVTAIARDLGVDLKTLYRWRRAAGVSTSIPGRPDGKFPKGVSGNPGGSSRSRELAQRLLEEATPAAVRKLLALIERVEDEADPDAAALLHDKANTLRGLLAQVLDRGLGKPMQKVEVQGDVSATHSHVIIPQEKVHGALDLLATLYGEPTPGGLAPSSLDPAHTHTSPTRAPAGPPPADGDPVRRGSGGG